MAEMEHQRSMSLTTIEEMKQNISVMESHHTESCSAIDALNQRLTEKQAAESGNIETISKL